LSPPPKEIAPASLRQQRPFARHAHQQLDINSIQAPLSSLFSPFARDSLRKRRTGGLTSFGGIRPLLLSWESDSRRPPTMPKIARRTKRNLSATSQWNTQTHTSADRITFSFEESLRAISMRIPVHSSVCNRLPKRARIFDPCGFIPVTVDSQVLPSGSYETNRFVLDLIDSLNSACALIGRVTGWALRRYVVTSTWRVQNGEKRKIRRFR